MKPTSNWQAVRCPLPHRVILGTVLAATVLAPVTICAQGVADSTVESMALAFTQKAYGHPAFSLELDIEDGGEWSVAFDGEGGFQVAEGDVDEPAFRFNTDSATFRRMAEGELTGMTAMAQATAEDPIPLDMAMGPGVERLDDARALFLQVAMHFFNPTVPGTVRLGLPHSRTVHGSNAVALFYHEGFRSGWYHVRAGESLNEPGDTNPFPQAFIVLDGRGSIKLGERRIRAEAGRAYYIPPGSDHVVQADDDAFVQLLWLAWGPGA